MSLYPYLRTQISGNYTVEQIPAITVEREHTEEVAGMYLEQETDRDAMLEYERALKNITGAYGLGSDVKPENPVGYLALLDQEHYDKSVKRCYDAAVPMAQQIESRKALE